MIVSSSSMPTSIWSRMNSSPGPPCAARRASSAVSRVIGAERDRALEHRRAVALVRRDRGRDVAGGRGRRLDLLALDDHRAEVAADAAPLPPGVAPQLDGERVELAEVRRSLDRRARQPERRRGVAVVDALAPVVRLLLQHLGRPAPRSGQGDLGVEGGHGADPTRPGTALDGPRPSPRRRSPPARRPGRAGRGPAASSRRRWSRGHRAVRRRARWRGGSDRRAAPTPGACAAARRAGRASRRSAPAPGGSGAARRRRRHGGPRRRR